MKLRHIMLVIPFVVGAAIGFVGREDKPINQMWRGEEQSFLAYDTTYYWRFESEKTVPSSQFAMCSNDNKTWWPARDGVCYSADAHLAK